VGEVKASPNADTTILFVKGDGNDSLSLSLSLTLSLCLCLSLSVSLSLSRSFLKSFLIQWRTRGQALLSEHEYWLKVNDNVLMMRSGSAL